MHYELFRQTWFLWKCFLLRVRIMHRNSAARAKESATEIFARYFTSHHFYSLVLPFPPTAVIVSSYLLPLLFLLFPSFSSSPLLSCSNFQRTQCSPHTSVPFPRWSRHTAQEKICRSGRRRILLRKCLNAWMTYMEKAVWDAKVAVTP